MKELGVTRHVQTLKKMIPIQPNTIYWPTQSPSQQLTNVCFKRLFDRKSHGRIFNISVRNPGPEEKNSTGQFGLRHSANCLFSEVDMSSVPYLGHLPQDLLGTSALDFYHPNDLPELKKIYDSVIGRQGKSIRSKPYNFRAFNGCYVLLETDWTCFVNPWTKKLEFVAGHHRVLKGPSNPDVFASPPEGTIPFMETLDPTAVENTKKLHAEICTILTGSN